MANITPIEIRCIPHSEHRYPTLGDYWTAGGKDHIVVSEMADPRHSLLVAIHELIEWSLCAVRGIAEPDISAFDIAHPDADEPGNLPDAPYHREHVFAECIERLVARELGVNWQEYEAACEAMFE